MTADILYGELWQQTHYGTMTVDSAKENIVRFFQSDYFKDRVHAAQAQEIEELTKRAEQAEAQVRVLRDALARIDVAISPAAEAGDLSANNVIGILDKFDYPDAALADTSAESQTPHSW